MTVTLLQLKDQARQRADMETSSFVSDSELTSYINASIAELHDILIQSYGEDYFVTSSTFATVNGTEAYALPSTLYKLHGVDISINGDEFLTIKRFNFNERNRFTDSVGWTAAGIPSIRYRIVGANIMFTPVPDGSSTVKLWFSPLAVKLVVDSDSLNDFNQYSEYIVVDAAIKMMQKEESDVSVLMAQKQALLQRITYASQNRDAGEPEAVSDVYAEIDDYLFRR
jgi:flagellar biosynthesis/type III secretory pathway chaperone